MNHDAAARTTAHFIVTASSTALAAESAQAFEPLCTRSSVALDRPDQAFGCWLDAAEGKDIALKSLQAARPELPAKEERGVPVVTTTPAVFA